MPIIVGTITVIVTPCVSMFVEHRLRLEDRHERRRRRRRRGSPRIPPIDAAWNIGVWCRYTKFSSSPQRSATWYRFSISARWSSSTPFGSPVVPPVYMRIDGIVLVGLLGDDRLARRRQLLVAEVVRDVALADQHDLLDPGVLARTLSMSGANDGVGEAHLRPRVARG